jgi:L-amino acid N-acyltransferase YncA
MLSIRPARTADADEIAAIFAQGVDDRLATFETSAPTVEEWERRIAATEELVLVAEDDGRVIAVAIAGPYTDRHHYYAGVGEATMYVEREHRRRGVGLALLSALADAAQKRGTYKLVGKIITTNEPSIELVRRCGFDAVGVHRRHGRLDGEWRDVLVVERLLGEAADGPGDGPG